MKFELFVFVSKKKSFDNFFISILNTFKKFLCFFVWIFIIIHLLIFLWREEKRREEKRFFFCETREVFSQVWKKVGKRKRKRLGRDFFSLFWVKGMKENWFLFEWSWWSFFFQNKFSYFIYLMKLLNGVFLDDWEENKSKEYQKKNWKKWFFCLSLLCFVVNFFLLFSLSLHNKQTNKQTNNNSVSVSSNDCQNFNFLFLLIELLVLSFVPTTIKRKEIERNEENEENEENVKKKKKREKLKNKTFNWMINSTMFWSFATSTTVFPS